MPARCFITNSMSRTGARYVMASLQMCKGRRWRPSSCGLEALHELRHRGEQVGLESVVGDLEDRRLRVLVDRDDDLRVLHPREVLDGAADAAGDVQLRRDDLAG